MPALDTFKIRIVHLVTNLHAHGAERVMAQLVTGSDPRRFHHQVVSMGIVGPIGEDLKSAGIEVCALNLPVKFSLMTAPFQLASLLRRSKVQVLHCWMYHANLFGTLVGKMSGVSHIVWGVRSSNPDLNHYSVSTRSVVQLCRPFSRLADVITVNSRAGQQVHEVWGYPSEKTRLIPNGFDVEFFKPNECARIAVRDKLGVADDMVLIGLIARFHPIKDHPTFLKAAGLLKSSFPQVRFLLCGDGISSDNRELMQMLHDNQLDSHVHLMGPRNDIASLMATLDINCLSSTSEAFPNVVGEAMACGVPCVVTNVGDAAAIVGDTGCIVSAGDPQAFADACSRLIVMGAPARNELGRKARERIATTYDLTTMVRSYEAIYESTAVNFDSQTAYSVAS